MIPDNAAEVLVGVSCRNELALEIKSGVKLLLIVCRRSVAMVNAPIAKSVGSSNAESPGRAMIKCHNDDHRDRNRHTLSSFH